MTTATQHTLAGYGAQLEALALELGMDFYPVNFDLVPSNFMVEIAVHGLPVRLRHWSFGIRYIHHLVRQHMGHSHIVEAMFPGDPCQAYMQEQNSLAENTLVTAHALGHADFAKNKQLFTRFMDMAGSRILERSAARANRLERALQAHGLERVEAVLDAALSLEIHIDTNQPLHRPPYPEFASEPSQRPPPPPRPEADLLWFIARYAPELEDWERDIFLAVREEAYYFHPIHACQIMNEGWASYWHARLLCEATFLPHELYLAAIKSHPDVVRPFAGSQQLVLSLNPCHLGCSLWEYIIEKHGMDKARQICREEDDFGFIRNYLDQEISDRLDLFVYEARRHGETRIATRDIHAIREAILAPRFNYGAPSVMVSQVGADGSLDLRHDYLHDGAGWTWHRPSV
ncbi:SpoVR family protein [Massilia cavernae]|uniref:SpoVR family protein n=1 Tax=Massilia cavernae TaxID=2320864 RepID=UPI001E5F0E20|nr:SpoVR family protein [Massilia cavernae]